MQNYWQLALNPVSHSVILATMTALFFWGCSTSWKIPRELELTPARAYADSHTKITCALAKCPRGESFSYPLAIFQINTQRNIHAHPHTHTHPLTHSRNVFYYRVFLLSVLPAAGKSLTRILSRRKVSDFLELKLKPKFVLQESKGIDTIFYSSLFPWFGFIDNVVSHRWYSDNAPSGHSHWHLRKSQPHSPLGLPLPELMFPISLVFKCAWLWYIFDKNVCQICLISFSSFLKISQIRKKRMKLFKYYLSDALLEETTNQNQF